MTTHHCPMNPAVKGLDDKWVEGKVTGCPYHGQDGRKQLGYKPGRGDRRKADKEAGVVGIDRGYDPGGGGGYIHGV